MDPRLISINDYSYDLPAERIAAYPLQERDASKLLVYKNGTIEETIYRNIDQYLPADSVLVFNDTKVIAARLLFQKPSGAQIELFCLEPGPAYGDIQVAMSQKGSVTWLCLIGGASKWKPGQVLEKKVQANGQEISLQATYAGKEKDSFIIDFSWTPKDLAFAEVLHYAGVIPLPPYIKRNAEALDAERYQTIYAYTEGSVAAPTAGLHFTPAIFENLQQKHIHCAYVTLHVGAGTFKPVKSAIMNEHEMHGEFIDVTTDTLQNILSHADKHITVVGTTSLRTVESLYWLGLKTIQFPEKDLQDLTVQQWDPYKMQHDTIPASTALQVLLSKMNQAGIQRLITKTALLIAPGYSFKIAKALVTNFHQPHSTLLLLVAAFAGKDWRSVYNYALENDFRFLSYGDGCLLFRG